MIQVKFKANGHTYEEFMKNDAMKAIAFEYLIPLPFIKPLLFESKLTIVTSQEEERLRKKYNRLNFIFSPLGLPFAPIFAIMAKKMNREGFDRTIDFRKNLKPGDFERETIAIEEVEELFFKPEKSVVKAVEKAFCAFFETYDSTYRMIILAEPVSNVRSEYCIGVPHQLFLRKDEMNTCLKKEFLRHVQFHFYNLDETNEEVRLLQEQGVRLFAS